MGLHVLLRGYLYIFICRLCSYLTGNMHASTACYGDCFTFIYVDEVRTSQETTMGLHGLLQG
jgi:hypothetical protein